MTLSCRSAKTKCAPPPDRGPRAVIKEHGITSWSHADLGQFDHFQTFNYIDFNSDCLSHSDKIDTHMITPDKVYLSYLVLQPPCEQVSMQRPQNHGGVTTPNGNHKSCNCDHLKALDNIDHDSKSQFETKISLLTL